MTKYQRPSTMTSYCNVGRVFRWNIPTVSVYMQHIGRTMLILLFITLLLKATKEIVETKCSESDECNRHGLKEGFVSQA